MKARWIPLLLIALSMAAAMGLGAIWGFPVFDDAYYLMSVREGTVADIAAHHRDRPVYGALLQAAAMTFGRAEAPCMAIALGFWALLAWQTHQLWKRLFPEQADLSPIAAALAFAPLLVDIQFTTLTTVIPVTLPVTLGLAALLFLLRKDRDGALADWTIAAALTALAVLVSEYAIATAAACAALLLGVRRWRSAIALGLGTALGYVAFRLAADISDRSKVDSVSQLGRSLGNPWTTLSQWATGLWYTLGGAYGAALSEIRLNASSKSTWIAVLAGGMAAAGAAAWLRARPGLEPSRERSRHLAALLLAVGAGLCVVVLANSNPVTVDPYRSRYRLPVVPFAVAATLAALDRVIRPRYRAAVFASLVFLAAWRVADGAFEARREQQILEEVGRRLLPLVRDSTGLVIGVIPDRASLRASDLTPKVTKRWTDEASRRVVVMPGAEAREIFGTRFDCRSPDRVELRVKRYAGTREGTVSSLVWVPTEEGEAAALEPYCLAPRL